MLGDAGKKQKTHSHVDLDVYFYAHENRHPQIRNAYGASGSCQGSWGGTQGNPPEQMVLVGLHC